MAASSIDGSDAAASCGRRENTTVAPQALALLNDKFVRARAIDFAQRVEKEAGAQAGGTSSLAWRLALGREPSASEVESGTAFLQARRQQRATRAADQAQAEAPPLALADLCQAIFALNEFIYVD